MLNVFLQALLFGKTPGGRVVVFRVAIDPSATDTEVGVKGHELAKVLATEVANEAAPVVANLAPLSKEEAQAFMTEYLASSTVANLMSSFHEPAPPPQKEENSSLCN